VAGPIITKRYLLRREKTPPYILTSSSASDTYDVGMMQKKSAFLMVGKTWSSAANTAKQPMQRTTTYYHQKTIKSENAKDWVYCIRIF